MCLIAISFKTQIITDMKKIITIVAVALLSALAFSSCNKDKVDITNTILIRGSKLPVTIGIYAIYDDFVNFDMDAGPEASNLHGYGGFPKAWIGKTTQLSGDFFMSYNPMEGPSINPRIKSGTATITQLEPNKLHVLVDAVETDGVKFQINCVAYDETKINWDTFKYTK